MEAATLSLPQSALRGGPLATDDELVAATRAGDDRAFEQLYGRYHRRIAAYVLGMVKDHQRAEDVTQDVFLSAVRRMRQTDRPIAFKPWIYEIARNACIDAFRRSRRGEEVSFDAEEGVGPTLACDGPTPDAAVVAKQQLDDLCGAFGGLSDVHHRILVMRELEGLSYAEIGERLEMTRPAVESTLFRARKRLAEEYEELVSGARCARVQAIIAAAEHGSLGARDRRRMARHVSYCQPCRRAAAGAGLGELAPQRTGVRAKIAGLLPLPALLRMRWLGAGAEPAAGPAGGGSGWAGWMHAAAPVLDAGGGWAKAVATAAVVAVAGVGAGVATRGDAPADRHGLGLPAAVAAAREGLGDGGAAARDSGEVRARPVAVRRVQGGAGARRSGRSLRVRHRRHVHAVRHGGGGAGGVPAGGGAAGGGRGASAGGAARTASAAAGTATRTASSAADDAGRAAAKVVSDVGRTVGDAASRLPAAGTGASAPSVPSSASVGDTAPTVPSVDDATQTTAAAVDQVQQTAQDAAGAAQDTTTQAADTLLGG